MMSLSDIAPNQGARPRICPNGCGRLTSQIVGPVKLDRCQTCAGIYLDKDLVERLRNLPARRLVDIDEAVVPSNVLASALARQRVDPRPCPNCRTLMLPYEVQCHVLVVLDKCGACEGIWADDRELEAVVVEEEGSEVHFGKKLSDSARDEIVRALAEQIGPRHPPNVVEEAFADAFPTFASWIRHAPGDEPPGYGSGDADGAG
jgi:Zn-finger nucleic acid-binding protein